MASIYCVTNGLPGILYSSVELARRLHAVGHRLTYVSFPHVRDIVEHHGLDFMPLEPSGYDRFLNDDARTGTLTRLRNLNTRRERAKDSLAVDSFVRAVRAAAPDLILIDGEMHVQIIAVSATGVPMALLNTFVSIWRVPGLPPPHHLARPGVGWKGTSFGSSLLWHALWLRKQRRAWLQTVRRVGCDRLSVLRRLARQSGFDFRNETDDRHWLIPFTYKQLPALSLHAFEFEFPHRPLPRVHYVGPMLLESRIDDRITDAVRAELEAIFARRRNADGKRKLIYAGFGSFFSTNTSLLLRLFQIVEERADWDLVVSLGGRSVPSDLGRLPNRVYAFAWLPQMDVLRHADVAVTHGGINTIDECVACGVPMLIFCDFKTDMAGNTSRVVYHEVGIAGDRDHDSVQTIRAHIDRLLYEPLFRKNVKRLQSRYLAYTENHVVERTVDSLLDRPARVLTRE